MAVVLHLEASPKGDGSASSAMARAFLDAYAARHPEDEIRTRSVWSDELPTFGRLHAEAKFAPLLGEAPTAAQERAWQEVDATLRDFDAADKLVLSCPMWNYGIPGALKNYIDLIVQPGLSFGFDFEKGVHVGLLRDRPTQLLLTRSSTPEGDAHDFQLPYLRHILDFIGIRDVHVIVAGATTRAAGERESYVAAQCELARAAAGKF